MLNNKELTMDELNSLMQEAEKRELTVDEINAVFNANQKRIREIEQKAVRRLLKNKYPDENEIPEEIIDAKIKEIQIQYDKDHPEETKQRKDMKELYLPDFNSMNKGQKQEWLKKMKSLFPGNNTIEEFFQAFLNQQTPI